MIFIAACCDVAARGIYWKLPLCLHSTRDHAGTIRVSSVSNPKGSPRVYPGHPVGTLRQGLLLKQNRSPRDAHGWRATLPGPFWFFHSGKTWIRAARKAKISRSIKLTHGAPHCEFLTESGDRSRSRGRTRRWLFIPHGRAHLQFRGMRKTRG